MSISGISAYTTNNINSIYSRNYDKIHNSETINSVQRSDSVSISLEAQAMFQQTMQIKQAELNQKSAAEGLTIGLFGEADTNSVDLVYIPPAIVDAMPKFDASPEREAAMKAAWEKIAAGEELSASEKSVLQPDHKSEFSEIKSLWNQYKSILTRNGIDYSDSEAFTEFMGNEELRNAVDKEFESRI